MSIFLSVQRNFWLITIYNLTWFKKQIKKQDYSFFRFEFPYIFFIYSPHISCIFPTYSLYIPHIFPTYPPPIPHIFPIYSPQLMVPIYSPHIPLLFQVPINRLYQNYQYQLFLNIVPIEKFPTHSLKNSDSLQALPLNIC